MNLLVEDLIEFSQPCTDISEFKDINQILGEVVQMAQKEFSHQGVEIRAKFQEDLPIVKTNPQKIHTAFLHILRNMLQFANSGEEITITTSGKPVGLVSTGFISIHFSNKRAYIPYEDTYSIFLPFSVIQKKKIGLGLSIAQHIISAHGGDIWVESDRDLGTTFIIELPSFKNVSIDFIKKEMALQQENY
jgi:signal transduction histidine kinase